MTVRRFCAKTFGQTMMLAMSVSSSRVMKTTPLAVPGICRISTRPATVTRLSCGRSVARCSALGMAPRRVSRSRKKLHRMRLQRQAGRRVILHHMLAERHWRQGDLRLGKSSSLMCGASSGSGAAGLSCRRSCLAHADRVEPPRGPERGAAVEPERAEGIRLGEPLDGEARNAGDRRQPLDAGVAVAARRDELLDLVLVQPLNLPEAEAHGMAVRSRPAPACSPTALKLTSTSRTSTPCWRASRTSWAG